MSGGTVLLTVRHDIALSINRQSEETLFIGVYRASIFTKNDKPHIFI